MPGGTCLAWISRARSVIAGRSQPGSGPGKVESPVTAPPGRTRSNQVPGSVRVAGVLARCRTSGRAPARSACATAARNASS